MVNKTTEALYAIVPAAGVGSRMRANIPKQYLKLHEKTILEHTVEKLLAHPSIDKVIIAVSQSDPYFPELGIAKDKRVIRVDGGKERADSVFSALNYIVSELREPNAWALVHDAARPCIIKADIDKLIEAVTLSGEGGILAVPVRDTMKRSSTDNKICHTVERENLWHALTPQMFKARLLYQALKEAQQEQALITDEASAMEAKGIQPILVAGRADNFKITQPEDLDLAAFYLSRDK